MDRPGVTAVIFVIVEATLVMFVVKYRSRGRPREEEGPQIRGHTRLELIWTVIPVLIVAGIIGGVFYKLPGIKDVPGERRGTGDESQVEGRQFYWLYTYPNGAVTVNELRLPTGRPVDLEITAPVERRRPQLVGARARREDGRDPRQGEPPQVRDPGEPGLYKGQCAEFCGVQHALMLAQARIVSPADFVTWAFARRRAGIDLGQQTYQGGVRRRVTGSTAKV